MEPVTMSYIGRCKVCDAVCCAVADDPKHKKDVANALREFALDDLIIERVTHEYVRENFRLCTCRNAACIDPQAALPGFEDL